MSKITVDAAYDSRPAFVQFCQLYGIPLRKTAAVYARVKDRYAFCEALQALNPSRNPQVSLRLANLAVVEMMTCGSSDQPSVVRTSTNKISKKTLLKATTDVCGLSSQLETALLEFISMAGATVEALSLKVKEKSEALSAVHTARLAIEPLRNLNRAAGHLQPLFKSEIAGRSLNIPATPMEITDRYLARLWIDNGHVVTTTNNGPFANFMDSFYRCLGKELKTMADRLQAAKVEADSLFGTKDVVSQLKAAELIRRRNVFDRTYSGRTKRGFGLKEHARGVEESD